MLTGLALGRDQADLAASEEDAAGPGLIPLPLAAEDRPDAPGAGDADRPEPDHDHDDHPADAPHGFVSPWWNGCSAPSALPEAVAELPAPEGYVFAPGVDPLAVAIGGLGITYGETFKLHSLPGSRYTVFLDFDGHTTTGTNWNSYWKTSSFHSPAFSTDGSESFSASELVAIQQIWQRVAEYFSPFNINVTTEDPGAAGLTYSGTSDPQFGIRVVITDEGGKPWGGIGYVGSFAWGSDTPVFVYANNLADSAKYIADCVAHEVGHSLGLSHDGRGGDDYYWGHGGWAPVMGAGYDARIVQWSNGAYSGATTAQDDLAIITGSANMGVAWRADDHGNSFATATPLTGSVAGGITTVAAYGIISGSGSRNDVDMFRFDLAPGGSISFTVSAWSRVFVSGSSAPLMAASPFSMLDVGLVLYDAGQRVVASWNDTTREDAALQLSGLAGGTYYLAVDGVGWGDPMAANPTGWTEYGSLGQYMIRGTYTSGAPEPLTLRFEQAAVTTTESGGSAVARLRASGATGDVLVQLGGLEGREGSLSATSLLLTAANDWTAEVTITGRDDRDADGDAVYTLRAEAAGAVGASLAVTNLDDDRGAVQAVAYTVSTNARGVTKVTQTALDVAATRADDGQALRILESGGSPNFAIDARWKFEGLAAGNWRVQVDASSPKELFRLEYSVDGGQSWQGFAGAPASALAWDGSWVAVGVVDTLWVRVVDVLREGDSTRNAVNLDLLTIAPDPVWG